MPPKNDPYATRHARWVDVVLCLLTVALLLVVLLTAPKRRSDRAQRERSPAQDQLAAH